MKIETLPQLDGSAEAAVARLTAFSQSGRYHLEPRPAEPEALFDLGVRRGRGQAIELLRAQAALHIGFPGDAHRRKALNSAADALRDGRGVGRRRG